MLSMCKWPVGPCLCSVKYFGYLQAHNFCSYILGSASVANVHTNARSRKTPKTAVLMLHHGQPRTPFYATKHLAQASHHYYKLPLRLTSSVTRLYWPWAKKIGLCVEDYKYSENISSVIGSYTQVLQECLNNLIPEHQPFFCTHAFLYEEPNIPSVIADLIRQGMERLILLPLYAHYSCFQSGTMLNVAVKALDELTIPLKKDGLSVIDHRLRILSHVSFRCSTIDRWSNHPVAVNFWYSMLQNQLKDHDSLLFVAPHMRGYNSKDYTREVWATCQRLIEFINEALPWKIAWFSPWNCWPTLTMESIELQLYFLRRDRRHRTLVLPISSFIPSFETESLLPNILQDQGVDLVSPPRFSAILTHGFAELIKNHLMGRKESSRLSCRCKLCFSTVCLLREAMLAPQREFSSEIYLGNTNLNDKAVEMQRNERTLLNS